MARKAEMPRAYVCILEPILELREYLSMQSPKVRTARDLLLPRLISGQLTI